MIEMARRFLRQRFGSRAMAIALGVIALLTGIQAAGNPEHALGTGLLALALIAAGSVSRDVSGGAIQMILARPIRRTSYLFGRYAGSVTAYGGFLLVASGVAIASRTLLPRLFGASGMDPDLPGFGRGIAEGLANALLFAAILLFFSTFLRGYADVLALFVLLGALGMFPALATQLRRPGLARFAERFRENVLPEVEWSDVFRGQHVLGEATGRWVAAVVVFLALAVLIFTRREFTYGQD